MPTFDGFNCTHNMIVKDVRPEKLHIHVCKHIYN